MKLKNKKGWIRIVEAFIAILLLIGVLILIVDARYIGKKDVSLQVYEKELSILREIELSATLRNAVLGVALPMSWQDESFPQNLKDKIIEETPSHLECMAKICAIDNSCLLDAVEEEIEKDIYVRAAPIFADLTTYAPRQIKLFCWSK